MIPDQRSRNVIEQALDWAAANPESLEFVHSDKVGRKGHLPNMVGFGNLLGGIERQSAIWNRSVECIEGTARWLESCRTGFEAKTSRQPNLFPPFPGLSFEETFRCEFVTSDELQRVLPPKEIARLVAVPGQREMTRAVVESIADEIGVLAERTTKPDVVLIALPIEIIQRTYNARVAAPSEVDEEREGEVGPDLDFRGMLKAAGMKLHLSIQLLWPTTFDPAYKIPRKLKETSDRRTQDPATIAWNLLTALYYKAGGLPWRLARDARQLRTSFVGLSFYRSLDGEHIHTSTAQMFDERGEGLILRGGRMVESEEDIRAGDAADVQAPAKFSVCGQLVVKIMRGIGEGGKDQQFAIAGVDRVRQLISDQCLQMGQLCIM